MDFTWALLGRFDAATEAEALVREWLRALKLKLRANTLSSEALVQGLREAGARLQREQPLALCLLNVIQRVISLATNPAAVPRARLTRNLTHILSNLHSTAELPSLEQTLSFEELTDEILTLETDAEAIVALGLRHVAAGQLLLVYAHSRLMEQFALQALGRPGVSLLLVANTLARNPVAYLPELSENYAVIPDTAVYAFLPRVDKVFTDATAVMADGALLHDAGVYALCLAARELAVPVVVLAPLFRFTPLYAFSQETFNAPANPAALWPELRGHNGVEAMALRFDYVPAECVSLVVSQAGEFAPRFIHRALSDYYGSLELGYNFK